MAFLAPLFGLYAANKWANDKQLDPYAQFTHPNDAYKTTPFGLQRAPMQEGNYAGARYPRAANINKTTQPLKYDPPGVVGAGRSAGILRDTQLDAESWEALEHLHPDIFDRDIPFTGWNNSDANWRIIPNARSWPRTEVGAEFYTPVHFDGILGSGIGDTDHMSYMGPLHQRREIFSDGPISTVSWAHMRSFSNPVMFRQLD